MEGSWGEQLNAHMYLYACGSTDNQWNIQHYSTIIKLTCAWMPVIQQRVSLSNLAIT